jgi:VCBS repeat-containing protein
MVTDLDGDTNTTSSLVIKIVDDVPTANPDAENLAAAVASTTGNVITGLNELTPSASADTKGADNATVTGAHGTAASDVVVGTNTVIAGQWGSLTISSDGSYTYTRDFSKAGGGQDDVFHYTLTDGDTDTSTTTLTIHIGDSPVTVTEPAPSVTGSTQVLEAGLPTGTLHNGTSNVASDVIHVTAPDGVQSIQIGTTTLSQSDLANLGTTHITVHGADGDLVLTGWNATTGALSYTYTLMHNTSGDNTSDSFNVVVTDLDGDTNTTSSLVIKIVDDVPTANPDVENLAAAVASTTGNVITGALELTPSASADTKGADGATVTGAHGTAASDVTVTTNTVIAGAYGSLSISSDGSYTYTRDFTKAGGGHDDVFHYTLTDGDGDTSATTLTIHIGNSTPTVQVPDIGNAHDTVYEAGLATGSHIGNTQTVATGSIVVNSPDGIGSVSLGNVAINLDGTTHSTIADGTRGTIDAVWNTGTHSIDYTYTLNTNDTSNTGDNGQNVEAQPTFAVAVTDLDGTHSASSVLTINIVDDAPVAKGEDLGAHSYQAAAGEVIGNILSNGDISGADGPASPHISGITVNGQAGVAEGSGYEVVMADGSGTVHVSSTGDVTFDSVAGHNYGSGGTPFSLGYTIQDGDGDTSSATATFNIKGSLPTAAPDVAEVAEGGGTYNLMLVVDVSGSMGDDSGVAKPGGGDYTRLELEQQALSQLLQSFNLPGVDLNVQLITFSTNASDGSSASSIYSGSTAITDATTAIGKLTDGGNTNYDAAIISAESSTLFNNSAGATNLVYFLSDGQPNLPNGSVGISSTEQAAWDAFLTNHNATANAVGVGDGINAAAVAQLQNVDSDGNITVVTDAHTLATDLTALLPGSVSGNVISNDTFGSAGPAAIEVSSITIGANTYSAATAVGGNVLAKTSDTLTIKTGLGGLLTFNFDTGAWTYTPPAVTSTQNETIAYTIQDASGNHASSTLTITVDNVVHAPVITGFSTDSGTVGDHITNDTSLTISGTSDPSVTVTVYRDGVSIGTTTADNTGHWSLADATTLSDGHTYQYTATATDASNVTSVLSSNYAATIDTTIATPTVSLTSDTGSSNSDHITNNAGLTVSVAAADVTRTYAVDGGSASSTYTAPTADGSHTVVVTDTDAAGNTSSTNITFTLDKTAPTGGTPDLIAASDSGTSSTDNITKVTNPTFTVALNSTVVAGDTVELLVGGSSLANPVIHTITAADVSAHSVSLTVTSGDLGTDGSKSITAHFTDAAGNSSTTGALSITLDTAAPATPAVTAISNDTGTVGDHITSDTTLTVSGTAVANSTVTVFRDGVSIGTATANGSGNWSLADSTTLVNGHTYQYTAQTSDTAGNTSAVSASYAVTIDATAPTVVTEHVYTNIATSFTIDDSLLLANDTDLTALSITAAAAASGQAKFFDTIAHSGTDVNIDLDIGTGGNHLNDGGTTSFTYTVSDQAGLTTTGTDSVTYHNSTTLTGSTGNDIIIGGDSGNTIDGQGATSGHDHILAGGGDDRVIYHVGDVIDGGGHSSSDLGSTNTYLGDVLDVHNIAGTVDIHANIASLANIQTIDATGGGNQAIILQASDVIHLADNDTTFNPSDGNVLPTVAALKVEGNAGDTLKLDDNNGGQWHNVTASITNEPTGHNVYAFDSNGGPLDAAHVTAYVIVNTNVTVTDHNGNTIGA